MLREDNSGTGKNVVFRDLSHRTHLRIMSDEDFKILEEVYIELGTLYKEKYKHRLQREVLR
jgi:hypothetical protein